MSFRRWLPTRIASRVFAVFLESLRRIKQRGRGEKVQKRRQRIFQDLYTERAVYAPLENDDDDDDADDVDDADRA